MDDHQESHQQSRVDNRGAAYANSGPIYNAPVTHQSVANDNSVNYEVEKEDTGLKETLSKFVIGILGERRTRIGALVSGLLGAVSLVLGIQTPGETTAGISSSDLVVASFLFFGLAAVLFISFRFRDETRCPNCKMHYTMKEVQEGQVREVRTSTGVRQTILRTYRCTNCAHQTTRKTLARSA